MSVLELFKAGGWAMWPLLACSLVAVAIVIERLIVLRSGRILDRGMVQRLIGLAEGGRPDRAVEACRQHPGIFTNIVGAGLELAAQGDRESDAKEAIEDAGRHQIGRLNRYLGTLGTVVGISPLLGLLGTVLGMIDVFKTIADAGVGQAAALSSGISQALITTATGLSIAIPSLVAYNYLSERVEKIVADLESDSLAVLRAFYRTPGRGSIVAGAGSAEAERAVAATALRGDGAVS